ncbi:MAG: phytoene desaturase [Gammaproteobacteria bacterium]|nr:phytoene desaturase [Gammaproteobacteria bacterium]
MATPRIGIIGAGIGGLVAALDLAHRGFDVVLFERAASPGGKMREVRVGPYALDAGPTVFTLRGLFEDLFASVDENLEEHIKLRPANVLARHVWKQGEHLDLYADPGRTCDAIADFAGEREARGFLRFAADARRTYLALERSFIRAFRPSPFDLISRIGLTNISQLIDIRPFNDLYAHTGRYFSDPRLRQLFARYATYCGSSPFHAPATLALIAHVEQAGVWYVDGGMQRVAERLADLAVARGAQLRYATPVASIDLCKGRVSAVCLRDGERVALDALVCNADAQALAAGTLGLGAMRAARRTPAAERSLSAVTWHFLARPRGVPLVRHTVFFSADYRREFDALGRGLAPEPTVYVCAQDRGDDALADGGASERIMCLINAPATGDVNGFGAAEIESCEADVLAAMRRAGLEFERSADPAVITTPSDFERLFPGTGGALYGPASRGWRASFKRPGARSPVPGLYLAGGSAHPGAGVPMAAISGQLAARAVAMDWASSTRSRPTATDGGTSTR